MPKKPEAYYRPQSVTEALRLLAQPRTVALAGGTQLLASEAGVDEAVVDLQDLGLDDIQERDGQLHLGAMVTLTALANYLAQQCAGQGAALLLQQGIKRAGPNTYRNAATLGGITASRLEDSELLAILLVLEATIHFAGPEQEALGLADYLRAEGQPPGLIAALALPWLPGVGACERVARTPMDDPIVAVAAWQPSGRAPRLAATGIAARPCRLQEAESSLADGPDGLAIDGAAQAARETAVHAGDFRGSAAYRAEMAAVLTRRALQQLAG